MTGGCPNFPNFASVVISCIFENIADRYRSRSHLASLYSQHIVASVYSIPYFHVIGPFEGYVIGNHAIHDILSLA